MEIFGGFMVMMSIIGFFLAVVWLVMPFVVFAIKGKQDRTLELLETIEKRLAALERAIPPGRAEHVGTAPDSDSDKPLEPSGVPMVENVTISTETVTAKSGTEDSTAV